jgi:molybdenum cofactor cytidylyltransferase
VIAGVILAAGAGSRFVAGGGFGAAEVRGGSKLLADLGGRPLLSYSVSAMCAVPAIERVVVVLGADVESIRSRVDMGRAEVVVHPDWQSGQAGSLRCGLAAVSEAERAIVVLGDEPLITPAVISLFVDAAPGTRAVYNGRPGHPVLLGKHHMSALSSLTGDRGARDLLRGGATIECGELSSGRDVDTPEDLEAIRDETRAVV